MSLVQPSKSTGLSDDEEVRVELTYDAESDGLTITAAPELASHFEVSWTKTVGTKTPILSKRGRGCRATGSLKIKRKQGAARNCRVDFRVGDSTDYPVIFELSN
ncbi:hypothetical protein WMF38_05985 [Sorangium sp. So ce118]